MTQPLALAESLCLSQRSGKFKIPRLSHQGPKMLSGILSLREGLYSSGHLFVRCSEAIRIRPMKSAQRPVGNWELPAFPP